MVHWMAPPCAPLETHNRLFGLLSFCDVLVRGSLRGQAGGCGRVAAHMAGQPCPPSPTSPLSRAARAALGRPRQRKFGAMVWVWCAKNRAEKAPAENSEPCPVMVCKAAGGKGGEGTVPGLRTTALFALFACAPCMACLVRTQQRAAGCCRWCQCLRTSDSYTAPPLARMCRHVSECRRTMIMASWGTRKSNATGHM